VEAVLWPQSKDADVKLSALYYPYSRCVDLDALKLLAILYEEIVFIDPLEELFREFLITSDKGCQFVPPQVRERWRENQQSWEVLRKAGVVRVIDPCPTLAEYDSLLTAAFAADMADVEFVEGAEREGKAAGPWKMLRSRIPPSVNDAIRTHQSLSERLGPTEYYTESDYQIGVYAWEHYDHYGFREYVLEKLGGRQAQGPAWGGDPEVRRTHLREVRDTIDSSPLTAYEQLYLSGGGTCTENGRPFGQHPCTYVDTVSFSGGEPIRILAFSQGASISISQALLLADLHGFTPVTDSRLHQQLLTLKYRRAVANLSHTERTTAHHRSVELLERYAIVARGILLEALSPAFLQQLSLDQILRFREENGKALERFWVKMRELSRDLDDVPLGPGFEGRLSRLMDQVVVPEMQSVRDSLDASRRRMYGSLLSKIAAGVPASAVVSVFAGMSGAQLLALSVGAGLAAFGMSVPAVMEYWQERTKLGQNWLAFVTDLRGDTGRIEPSTNYLSHRWWKLRPPTSG
jgi:hypothetical protein